MEGGVTLLREGVAFAEGGVFGPRVVIAGRKGPERSFGGMLHAIFIDCLRTSRTQFFYSNKMREIFHGDHAREILKAGLAAPGDPVGAGWLTGHHAS